MRIGLGYHNHPSVLHCLVDGIIQMTSRYIRFPYTVVEQANSKRQFAAMSGFPNVIGAIDCTHIAIRAPSESEFVYVNRKNVHTINVQIICDPSMVLTNLVARWPGSTHDSFISVTLRSVPAALTAVATACHSVAFRLLVMTLEWPPNKVSRLAATSSTSTSISVSEKFLFLLVDAMIEREMPWIRHADLYAKHIHEVICITIHGELWVWRGRDRNQILLRNFPAGL